jgi:O-antigen/teichoic acid export membrane protein
VVAGRLPRANILANLAGNGWAALAQLLLVPVYLDVLGTEAFALVGVWATLQSVANLLDLGLSTTVNREMARRSAGPGDRPAMRDLLRSLEAVYWPFGLLIAAAVFAGAPWLATSWLNAERMGSGELVHSLRLIGVVMALQWPYDLYAGALYGLQRQVEVNVVVAGVATLRAVGGAAVLWFVSPTVQAFFAWQAACSVIQTLVPLLLVWRQIREPGHTPRARTAVLREVAGFAGGVLGISALSALLTQVDKIVVSRMLSLEAFGYYALAGLAASVLSRLVGPVFTAIYPRLTQLVAQGDSAAEAELYQRGTRLIAILVIPPALVLGAFAPAVLRIWTGDAEVAARAAPVLALLLAGTALNGIMHMPYALQLAHGWTALSLRINLAAAVLLPPALVLAARNWGTTGAAGVWAVLNVGYLVVGVLLMHRRLLRREVGRWYAGLLPPFAGALVVTGVAWLLVDQALPRVPLTGALLVTGIAAAAASAYASGLRPADALDALRPEAAA